MLTERGQECCFEIESADALVGMIKARQLEPYSMLDKFVSWLILNGFAPKTVRTYLAPRS